MTTENITTFFINLEKRGKHHKMYCWGQNLVLKPPCKANYQNKSRTAAHPARNKTFK